MTGQSAAAAAGAAAAAEALAMMASRLARGVPPGTQALIEGRSGTAWDDVLVRVQGKIHGFDAGAL